MTSKRQPSWTAERNIRSATWPCANDLSGRARSAGDPARRVTLYGVTGQTLLADLEEVRDFRLGDRRLGPTPLLFADLHCFSVMGLSDRPTVLVGADLLSRFREVMIDFPQQTIAFNGLRRASPRQMAPLTG